MFFVVLAQFNAASQSKAASALATFGKSAVRAKQTRQ
jgi:hypothetical protein